MRLFILVAAIIMAALVFEVQGHHGTHPHAHPHTHTPYHDDAHDYPRHRHSMEDDDDEAPYYVDDYEPHHHELGPEPPARQFSDRGDDHTHGHHRDRREAKDVDQGLDVHVHIKRHDAAADNDNSRDRDRMAMLERHRRLHEITNRQRDRAGSGEYEGDHARVDHVRKARRDRNYPHDPPPLEDNDVEFDNYADLPPRSDRRRGYEDLDDYESVPEEPRRRQTLSH